MSIDLSLPLPLCRGRLITLENGKQVWISFKYERLPNVCYWCGHLIHDDKECEIWIDSEGTLKPEDRQFGPGLRAAAFTPTKKMGLTVPGYYLSRKKAETFTESMEAELTANLEQPAMILKDKIQATGRRVTDGLDASKPPNNELKCNAQNSINCEAESTVRDINFGAENTLKLDMNAEPLIDPEHHEFQMHSITINTQLATPPNYEELNTQSKDNNWALKTQNNSKTTYLCLGELNTCATKEETCNEKLSEPRDHLKSARVSNPNPSTTHFLPTWTRKIRPTTTEAAPVSENCLGRKRGVLESSAAPDGPNK